MVRILFNLIAVTLATFAGNWVGAQIQFVLFGRKTYALRSEYTASNGLRLRNFPVTTKFYPGLLFALLGKPRWLFGFLGGLLVGTFVDDRLENMVLEWISQRIPHSSNPA